MRAAVLLAGAALTLTSAWAVAQDAPESLLPKMFQDPAPTQSAAPRPRPSPVRRPATPAVSAAPATSASATPVVQALPQAVASDARSDAAAGTADSGLHLTRLPTIEELAKMSPEDFESLIGRKVEFDMPPQARRAMSAVGVFDSSEGGLASDSLARANADLVRLALAGDKGRLVSRWGHIALRRALLSRLSAPPGMSPQDFLALRVALLLRMGEYDAARALLQGIDIANYSPAIVDQTLAVYLGTADMTGICPVMATQGSLRDDSEWDAARAICEAYRGNSTSALSRLDRDMRKGDMPRIDVLLAQRYAGAAGQSRRAVTIEWDEVKDMTPWRYALARAVGIAPPASLMKPNAQRYDAVTALAPMVGLEKRAGAASRAAQSGVLSNAALVDLYAQLYADPDTGDTWQGRAEQLRDAYSLTASADRIAAMRSLWSDLGRSGNAYGGAVLTAAAAARILPSADLASDAPDLIGSMLSAGYDANAARWSRVVERGSRAWALIALSAPSGANAASKGDVDSFVNADDSAGKRQAGFLVAGLAGLGRLPRSTAMSYSNDLGLVLDGETRWTRAIDAAADRGDAASVVILAGFGMQGSRWQRMTPRYLFHIVASLDKVGMGAEARMIAAEAIARTG
ncbi:hypothetical protein MTR62_10115 [Novosphingobium sp. 1949]|uniref:Lytic transglycosylase domain-containing protein n=1 Tax=Novosphingobium organovorum TaxID=2930092 RepID=A0ABT0BE27_9SPHN|nr:hypothetical protein [Novosphingobium organovorum]MCJ2183046.1 hypothetical protein [Novosphingobium organovorum]